MQLLLQLWGVGCSKSLLFLNALLLLQFFEYISGTKLYCMEFTPIAHYHSMLPAKFGVPRQSGLVPELKGRIVFLPEYRNPDTLRGIEGFDYLWLIWGFSLNAKKQGEWSPLVRPPLLGGNEHVGVFATRSPFRPNPIGLSSVHLCGVEYGADGPVLVVSGADLADGTPIFDIKPYVVYSDSHPGARSGFVDGKEWRELDVVFPAEMRGAFTDEEFAVLCRVLELDPRPQYHDDPERVYGMPFAGHDVRFTVSCEGVLRVVNVVKI